MGLKSQIISIHNLTYLFESRLIQVGQILTIHTKIKVSNWLSFCFFTVSTLWIGLLPPGSETTAQCIPVISRRTNCITLTISIHLQNVYFSSNTKSLLPCLSDPCTIKQWKNNKNVPCHVQEKTTNKSHWAMLRHLLQHLTTNHTFYSAIANCTAQEQTKNVNMYVNCLALKTNGLSNHA